MHHPVSLRSLWCWRVMRAMDKKQDRGGNGHFQPEGPLANFTYWAKMRAWKETEAASLFLGLNPYYRWHKEQHEVEIHGVLTLAISATDDRGLGGGPPMSYIGRRIPVYTTDDLDAWALSRISAPVRSTSDRRIKAA